MGIAELLGTVVKNLCIFSGIIGILVGLDLILGARVMAALKIVLDRSLDIDKSVISSKIRYLLGVLFLILSLVIIMLVSKS